MNSIYSKIVPLNEVVSTVRQILEVRYDLGDPNLKRSIQLLEQYLHELRPDLHVVIEHPYVDKVYRDTYYQYFASKLNRYDRDSIRLSFLSQNVDEREFRTGEGKKKVQECYRGFVTLRPTFPMIIGRSVIDPRAMVSGTDVSICKARYGATVNGIKVTVEGFPHSSQDGEAITCAETTIWSIMEYFGNKYSSYGPVLPSKVKEILGRLSHERQLPSKGLNAHQISFALRELGFGVRIYHRTFSENEDETAKEEEDMTLKAEFFRVIRTYIEGGIPVVGLINNDTGLGHAVNLIGHSKTVIPEQLDLVESFGQINGQVAFDFADVDMPCVMIDDNWPPYQTASLDEPTTRYNGEPEWDGCRLSAVVVPLYPKIYLEADIARATAISVIEDMHRDVNTPIWIRTLLASSRSFKEHVALTSRLDDEIKDLLLCTPMPKFIYITEVTDKTLLLNGQASGMVILDATEPMEERPGIIAGIISGIFRTDSLSETTRFKVPLRPFSNYQHNLR